MTAAAVAALLAEHYALSVASLDPLPGETDLNFRVTDRGGGTYCCKISPPDRDPAPLRFQADLLHRLSAAGLPVALPRPARPLVELPGGRCLRLLTWVPGRPLTTLRPLGGALRRSWGRLVAHLSLALKGYDHPDAPRTSRWDPSAALHARALRAYLTTDQRELADHYWDFFERSVLPRLPELPVSVVYGDAHGDNLLADEAGELSGLIDLGDALRTQTVNELAIACAYAGMKQPDPLGAMAELVAAYRELAPLSPAETECLFGLITGRLLLTVTAAAERAVTEPGNAYHQVSAAPAWAVLRALRDVHPLLAAVRFGYRFDAFVPPPGLRPVVDLSGRRLLRLDLGVGSHQLGNNRNFNDLTRFTRHLERTLEDQGADLAVGGYGEVRPVYTTDDFSTEGNYGPRWRTTHLGVDVWGPVGTPVYAPFAGRVRSCGVDPTAGGYGTVIILEHEHEGTTFFTLYGHLSRASISGLRAGARVRGGDEIASFGDGAENGGWPPHLHFQVVRHLLGLTDEFPGVAYPEEAADWLALCPDPHPFLGIEPVAPTPVADRATLLARRRHLLGRGLSLSYAAPLTVLRGSGQYLYDRTGRRYLDTVNNVAHVGHEHPRVVRALTDQAGLLNTNSRYLHPAILAFAAELTATLPAPLSVVHFVNSGSEANDLALRMCEAWSGSRNVLAIEAAYHGNTGRTIDVSGYKFDGPGGRGCPTTTKTLPLPDVLRGRHRDPVTAAADYAAYADPALAEWRARGEAVGGFIHESILSCGGQIDLPAGYLSLVYERVRAAGGLCVADEVQTGLGRVGSHWWAFERQGVVPDVVTMGKPLGNGHPLGAVVCTPEVAAAFANGMEYFNTFGGNPVSCAVGRAVLATVTEEGLRERAATTGAYLKTLLTQLRDRFPLIGDVRGTGLFLGCELVRPNLTPASAPARYLKERMRELGFLTSTDGPANNVLKIKPPLCFTRPNADLLVEYLARVLGEDGCRTGGE